jgi:fucose permease
VRSTGASVLTLVQNLLGLALGPFLAGLLSDAMGLTTALTLTPLACVIAVVSFLIARTAYQIERISEPPKQAAMVPCQEAFA